MKTQIFIISLLLSLNAVNGQINNIKAGNWSDSSIWNGNTIPGISDEVILNFDVVLDINATCALLNSNGHQVIVNTGVNLVISGNAADTLLARYAEVEASGGVVLDTARTIDFLYDSLKRNTIIDDKTYVSGVLDKEYYTTFFYQDTSKLPFKKILTTLFSSDPYYVANSTNFYAYQGDQLILDSADGNGISALHYSYLPGFIVRTQYYPPSVFIDTAKVEYLNGNITRQFGPVINLVLNDYSFVYDNHPNPFYHTQFKLVFSYTYPLYSLETFVEDIFTKNNATSIYNIGVPPM